MTAWLLRALGVLGPEDRLVRVISWWPRISGGELVWPSLYADLHLHRGQRRRYAIQPVWDRARFASLFRRDR